LRIKKDSGEIKKIIIADKFNLVFLVCKRQIIINKYDVNQPITEVKTLIFQSERFDLLVTNGFFFEKEKAICVVINSSIMTFFDLNNLNLLGIEAIYKPVN
jgi:hypothetical protein